VGFIISLRFAYLYFTGDGAGHIQSLLLSVLLIGTGFFLMVTALVADLIAVNRKLLEQIRWRVWRLEDYLRKINGYDNLGRTMDASLYRSTSSDSRSSRKRSPGHERGSADIEEPRQSSYGLVEKTKGKMGLRKKK
jgi:hypothetical protein